MTDSRLHIVHVVYSFGAGGLENGIVNLINHLPSADFRHTILSLTTCSPEFCSRIGRNDVHFIEMNKAPGHALKLYPALYRMFRQLKPTIVHTRNLAALEAVIPAWAAGVPMRIHGEHGWDVSDPDGRSRKYGALRRLYRPFVSHYVALSRHLASYVTDRVGVPAGRISRICNGVDVRRFHPAVGGRQPLSGSPLNESRLRVIGTVGRLQAIKDQINLVQAFASVAGRDAALRLMIVGDGPLRAQIESEIGRLGVSDRVWLAGERADIPDVMRAMDVFVLPSRAEGISNTILEAMASGLPVVATRVGGNYELVLQGQTGMLVPPSDPAALAEALMPYVLQADLAREHGEAARRRVEAEFSLDGMVDRYAELYGSASQQQGVTKRVVRVDHAGE